MLKRSNNFVEIIYSFVDGAHFFTSKDPKAKGLCVASADLNAAYNEVPHQLKILLKKNAGIEEVNCHSLLGFEDFKKWANQQVVSTRNQTRDDIFIPLPQAQMRWGSAA